MKNLETGSDLPLIPDAIRFRIEQYGHTDRKAAEIIGITPGRLSEVLHGKRGMSRGMQWKFYKYGIPPVVLIQPRKRYRKGTN